MDDERLICGNVEWRAAGADQRGPGTLTIVALTVGQRALNLPEVFDALPRTPDNGVLVGRLHPANEAPIIGRAPVEVRDGSLVVSVELPDTAAGRDTAIEVRNGTLTKASVEFRALRQRMAGGVRHILESMVESVALVPAGAYATKAEVRAEHRHPSRWLR